MAIDYATSIRNQITVDVQRYSISQSSGSYLSNELNSFEIQRVAEDTKFFGQVVMSKLNLKMRPASTDYSTDDRWYFRFGQTGQSYEYPFGYFYTTEVHTNENTGEKSITAYDSLKLLEPYTVDDLNLTAPYTIEDFGDAIAAIIGTTTIYANIDSATLALSYSEGANLEGTESLLDCLGWIAEVLGAVCFVDNSNKIVFKRLSVAGNPLYTISRDDYITAKCGEGKRLGKIIYATELGDNVEAHTVAAGSTQAVMNNPFLENREDLDDLVEAAITNYGGLTIGTFEMTWRGNPKYVIGDKIKIERKDGTYLTTFLLDETFTFDGSISSKLRFYWDQSKESDEFANPSTIGEAINQTYARVDKVNKEIALVVSEVSGYSQAISSLQATTSTITATVSTQSQDIAQLQEDTNTINNSINSIEDNTSTAINNINDEIVTLTNQVSAKMTAEDVQIAIQSEMANGVDKITTTTGYTFDEDGLTISKSGSEMTTEITEDGMTVYRDNNAVLVANNIGVEATNLHANTYLIIGTYSRFEDYGSGRTGCFWIGS